MRLLWQKGFQHNKFLNSEKLGGCCRQITCLLPAPFHLSTQSCFNWPAVVLFCIMSFTVPQKRILTKEDLEEFQTSDSYTEFIGFVERLNESVKGLKIDSEIKVSKVGETL